MADATSPAGRARIVIRNDTGKVISRHTVPVIRTEHGGGYRIEFGRAVRVGHGETATITMLPEENHDQGRRPEEADREVRLGDV